MAQERGKVSERDKPYSSPMPATAVNSVTSELTVAMARPATEIHAHHGPKRSRMSSA
jgi:hypothetical protein